MRHLSLIHICWGGEYKNDALSTTSDLVFIGDGTNGRDAGNLGLVEGKSLELSLIHIFISYSPFCLSGLWDG